MVWILKDYLYKYKKLIEKKIKLCWLFEIVNNYFFYIKEFNMKLRYDLKKNKVIYLLKVMKIWSFKVFFFLIK